MIHGDINLTSVSLNTSPNAVIDGNINENTFSFDELEMGQIEKDIQAPIMPSPIKTWVDCMITILWAGVRILAVSAVAALAILIVEKPTNRVRQSMTQQLGISAAFGVLTVIVAPVLLLLLAITIILIPVALLVVFALAVGCLFGWVAIGYEIGVRLEKSLKQNWAPAITCGIGTFFLTLASSLVSAIPCIGWLFPFAISIIGLGGVMISRFGTMIYASAENHGYTPQQVNTQNQADERNIEKPGESSDTQTPNNQQNS